MSTENILYKNAKLKKLLLKNNQKIPQKFENEIYNVLFKIYSFDIFVYI